MTTDQTPPNDTQAPAWPQGGYAPGSYWCKCVSCNQQFTDDKRAYQCPDCIIQALASHSAAREAAAVLEMRDRLASLEHTAAKYGYDEIADAVKAVADDLATADASAALDRLIAERVREAVEATWRDVEAALEKEINAEWFTSEVNGKPVTSKGETEFMRLTEAKRVFDMLKANVRAARGSKEGQP